MYILTILQKIVEKENVGHTKTGIWQPFSYLWFSSQGCPSKSGKLSVFHYFKKLTPGEFIHRLSRRESWIVEKLAWADSFKHVGQRNLILRFPDLKPNHRCFIHPKKTFIPSYTHTHIIVNYFSQARIE